MNNCYILTKGYGVRATTIEGQNALHQRCALHTFHVTDSQNTRDQITSILKINSIKGILYDAQGARAHFVCIFERFSGHIFLKFS